MAAPTLAPTFSTDFQQLNSLSAASQILCHAQMQAAFGPRRVLDLLTNARHHIQKQIDQLAEPIFECHDAACPVSGTHNTDECQQLIEEMKQEGWAR